jgi:hypothetical protein
LKDSIRAVGVTFVSAVATRSVSASNWTRRSRSARRYSFSGRRSGLRAVAAQSSGIPSVESPATAAEIERLADLHARGILSDDEFQQAKQNVLRPS